MLINISDIVSSEDKEVTKEVLIGLESFDTKLGRYPITRKAPIELKITNRRNRKLFIRGEADLTVTIPCDRCLEDVPTDIHLTIDKEFSIENQKLCGEEMEDNNYLTGTDLDVDKLIYEEILVNLPTKVLCREDCKGICKVCGINLNKGTCNCPTEEMDPRLAAFEEIFNKIKEV